MNKGLGKKIDEIKEGFRSGYMNKDLKFDFFWKLYMTLWHRCHCVSIFYFSNQWGTTVLKLLVFFLKLVIILTFLHHSSINTELWPVHDAFSYENFILFEFEFPPSTLNAWKPFLNILDGLINQKKKIQSLKINPS